MRIISTAATLAVLLAAGGCTSPGAPPPADEAMAPVIAPLSGYLLGDIVGGRRARAARAAGAGLDGIGGSDVGGYMDREESALRAAIAGSQVEVIRQGDDLILRMPASVAFAYASAAVQPQFEVTLDQIAGVLHQDDETYVDVYGFTDATGSERTNQQLSQRRADAVAQDLATRGVLRARLGTKGFGATNAIAPNDTPEHRATNRRVEIRVVPIPASDIRG